MASIKDSLEETFNDRHSILKLLIFALPLFYSVYLFTTKTNAMIFNLLNTYNCLFLFGLMLKCTQNVRNGKDYILPSFNIFKILWTGFVGYISLFPLIIIVGGLMYFADNLIVQYIPNDLYAKIFSVIIDVILLSIVYTGCILYSKRFKFFDIYNLNLISKYSIDILIEIFFLYIKLLIVNLILILPLGYILWLFLGLTHYVTYYFASVILVYNVAIVGHYLAQIDYEIIERKEAD